MKGKRTMEKHTMTFDSFIDKRMSIDWIKENIEPDNEDEMLTSKLYIFFTGVALTKRQVKLLQQNCSFKEYSRTDF
jgi:hypothetical protein